MYGNSTFRPEICRSICPPYHTLCIWGAGGGGAGLEAYFFSFCLVFSAQNDRFSYWALHLICLQDSIDLAAINSDLLCAFFFRGRKFVNSPLELRLMVICTYCTVMHSRLMSSDFPEDWVSWRSICMSIARPPQPQDAYSGRGLKGKA